MDIIHSPFWILLAKTVLAVIMLGFAAVCLIVWRQAPAWRNSLAELEYECDVIRDETMMQATIVRGQLVEIQERLKHRPDKAEMEVVGSMVKHAMPILSMLMQRETNLMKWGMAGAKLVKSAFEYFNSKNS
jgi:hypothetical protein